MPEEIIKDKKILEKISFSDVIETVIENKRLIIARSTLAGVLALIVSLLLPPTYTAKTQFLPPQQQQSSASALIQSLGSMGGLAAATTALKNPADQYVSFLKTQSILDAMVEKYQLNERYSEKFKVDARKKLQEKTRIQAGKDSIIQIEVDDYDSKFAAEMANGYVNELRKLMSRLSLTEAQQRREFFGNKIIEAKLELAEADKLLRTTGISASTLKSSPIAAVEIVAKIKGAITAQELKIAGMNGYLSEKSPEMRQAYMELENLKKQIEKAENKETNLIIGKLEDSYVEKYRDYKYKEALYEMFAKQYELAKVDEAREGAIIQVIDVALPPEKKSSPKPIIITLIILIFSALLAASLEVIKKYQLLERKND